MLGANGSTVCTTTRVLPFQALSWRGVWEVHLTVVVDHDTGRLVGRAGARPQDGRSVPGRPGPDRCSEIELVSCDMASWISMPLTERLPGAVRCVDPFHVVQLGTDALDTVRREVWNQARRAGQTQLARDLKGARFAVWKNPEHLTDRQRSKLAWIEKLNTPLFRAYLLKEQLRQIYRLPAL